jgi:hypothetical protein
VCNLFAKAAARNLNHDLALPWAEGGKRPLRSAKASSFPAMHAIDAGRERLPSAALIKARMGATHFLMKTLPRVASEMALHVLAYNLTRVMNIMGIRPLMAAMRT